MAPEEAIATLFELQEEMVSNVAIVNSATVWLWQWKRLSNTGNAPDLMILDLFLYVKYYVDKFLCEISATFEGNFLWEYVKLKGFIFSLVFLYITLW